MSSHTVDPDQVTEVDEGSHSQSTFGGAVLEGRQHLGNERGRGLVLEEALQLVGTCQRCKHRRKRCDTELPTCAACHKAGVECLFYDHWLGQELPRSYVDSLYKRLRALHSRRDKRQSPLLDSQQDHPGNVSTPTTVAAGGETNVALSPPQLDRVTERHPARRDPLKESIIFSPEMKAMLRSTLAGQPHLEDSVSKVRMGLTPSLAKFLSTNGSKGTPPSAVTVRHFSKVHHVGAPVLTNLPHGVIQTLVGKYIQHVLPLHPFLHEPHIRQQVKKILTALSRQEDLMRAPDYDYLIIYLILAIAVTLGSSRSTHHGRHMDLSESLFVEGMQHYSAQAMSVTDLASIQATLLMLAYAQVNPKCGNVWILSGSVMRSCLELGLHREPSTDLGFNFLTRDLRRRIFWTAYCFDRTICSTLQRPLSIPDLAIDALLPSRLDDQQIHPDGVEDTVATGSRQATAATKLLALREIQHRRLQSRVIEVHFQGAPLDHPNQPWEEWLSHCEAQLNQWADQGRSSAALPDMESTDFHVAHGLVNVHRPSPRCPHPSSSSLLVAFDASCRSAFIYREQILSGHFRRPWLAAHYTQEAATVALFALRHELDGIVTKYGLQVVFDKMKIFTSNFLAISTQGWPEISAYAAVYEGLLNPILTYAFAPTPKAGTMTDYFTEAHDKELNELLYPSPAQPEKLRFGTNGLPPEKLGIDFTWDEDLLRLLDDQGDALWMDVGLDNRMEE